MAKSIFIFLLYFFFFYFPKVPCSNGKMCYDLITQVTTLALRLEDRLRVKEKRTHNRLSIGRYSVSTGAYILIVV